MAYYSQLKLPPLKLTVTHRSKSVSRKMLFRGVDTVENTGQEDPNIAHVSESENSSEHDLTDDHEPTWLTLDLPDAEPTHHELQCKSYVKGWEQLRTKLVSVFTERSAMPVGQECLFCAESAKFRCQECGPHVNYAGVAIIKKSIISILQRNGR